MAAFTGWLERFASLGRAILDLLAAELAELKHELRRSGRQFLLGLVLLALAGGVVFWLLGVLVWGGIQILSQWLPPWGASLTMAGILGLAAGALAALGLGRIRSAELPTRTVRRRLEDHLEWWQGRMLRTGEPVEEPSEPEEGP